MKINLKFHLKSKTRINATFLSFILLRHTKKGVIFKYFWLQNSARELTIELLGMNICFSYLRVCTKQVSPLSDCVSHKPELCPQTAMHAPHSSLPAGSLPCMLLSQVFLQAPCNGCSSLRSSCRLPLPPEPCASFWNPLCPALCLPSVADLCLCLPPC